MQQRTYLAKLSCSNCGMRGFYKIPATAEFWSMEGETGMPHSYDPSYIEHTDESRENLDYRNCGVPCLGVEYWDEPGNITARTGSKKVSVNG